MALPQTLMLDAVVVERRDTGGKPFRILDLPHLAIAAGRCIGIAGPSGAGKSTILDVIAGITPQTQGSVRWGDQTVSALPEGRRDRWRRDTVGIVFQDFHLIPELSVEQNVLLPKRFAGFGLSAATRKRARDLIALVGLDDPGRSAGLLSRGEQQRVAIARALIGDPALILADEPTASLDAETGQQVADLLVTQARQAGATLILVSHDPTLIARMDSALHLAGGRLRDGEVAA